MPVKAFNENFDYPITDYIEHVSDWVANTSASDNLFSLNPLGIYYPGVEYNKNSLRMPSATLAANRALRFGGVDPAAESVIDTSPWIDGEVRYYSALLLQNTAISANGDLFRVLWGISNGLSNSNMDALDFRIERIAGVDTLRYRRGNNIFTNFGTAALNTPYLFVTRVTRAGGTLTHEVILNPDPNTVEGSLAWTNCGTTEFNSAGNDLRHDYCLVMSQTSAVAYLDEVRYGNNYSDVVVPSNNPAPSADLIILAGQSNMVGHGTISALPTEKKGFIGVGVNNGSVIESLRLKDTPNNKGSDSTKFGPEVELGYQIVQERNETVVFVKHAIAGSRLANDAANGGDAPGSWHPDYVGTNYYNGLVGHITDIKSEIEAFGHTVNVSAACWMQGESDAKTATPTRHVVYQANLLYLINSLRAAINTPSLPFIIGRIHNSLDPVTFEYAPQIRQAIENVCGSCTNTYMIDTDSFGLLGDSLHYDTTGQVSLGAAYANILFNNIIKPVKGSWNNPLPWGNLFIPIQNGWLKDGEFYLSDPTGGQQVQKGWSKEFKTIAYKEIN